MLYTFHITEERECVCVCVCVCDLRMLDAVLKANGGKTN